MSWFSTNYEKATLGAAVAIALGFAYLGWSKNAGVDQDFGADIGEGGSYGVLPSLAPRITPQ